MPIERDAAQPSVVQDSVDALAVSARLTDRIVAEIAQAGGWIPFSRFMELALYAPGLGYYSAGAAKIGHHPGDGSDFVTAPELTPLFARALARPVAEILGAGGDTILELGGGSGRMAADLLLELETLDRLPQHYLLLDVSADLRARQAATLEGSAPHLRGLVRWIDALPARIEGAIVGNEVLDALPVELVVWDGEAWRRRGVETDGRGLVFGDREAAERSSVADLGVVGRPVPYVTERHPAAVALVRELVARMSADSAMLLIDYGFPASEYYHPQRSTGTLMAHRRHRASHEVLAAPGLQDITAHVDFSAIAAAAASEAGVVVGYTNQASFLIDCGIVDLVRGSAADIRSWAPQAAALQTLLSEAEMGELFKVIGIGRRPWRLTGFARTDRSPSL